LKFVVYRHKQASKQASKQARKQTYTRTCAMQSC